MGMLDNIRKMNKRNARIWQYDTVGDSIAGEILTPLRVVETSYGKMKEFDVMSEEHEEIVTIKALTVIANEFMKQCAEVGDEVGRKYLGKVKNYQHFLVVVQKKKKAGPTQRSPINYGCKDAGIESNAAIPPRPLRWYVS